MNESEIRNVIEAALLAAGRSLGLSELSQVFEDGIGISNVHERLRVLYGADFRMDISSREGEGTRIRIEIPELVPTASEPSAISPGTKA